MKDERFKELVHLYLDGEIQPREFQRLRKEISRFPSRRAYFLQHCRLHRALSIALKKDQNPTLLSQELAYEKIRKKRTRRTRIIDWTGAMAALIIIAFFALPPSLVNSWMPGELGSYAVDVRGGLELAVKDMKEAFPIMALSEQGGEEFSTRKEEFFTELPGNFHDSLSRTGNPWDEYWEGQPWWNFGYSGLDWFLKVVDEEGKRKGGNVEF